MRALLPHALILAGSTLAAGCHISIGHSGHLIVDGVELRAEHTETLEVGEWPAEGLRIESSVGDLRVEPGHGRSEIIVRIHEVSEGDAHASFHDGELVLHTLSGEPAGIGDVVVRTDSALPHLVLVTGMGDIEVEGVQVEGNLELETGMGNLEVDGVGSPDHVALSSGMGDIELGNARCRTVDADSGMGDLVLTNIEAVTASLTSGLGDVEVHGSTFGTLNADTGIGDIDCVGTRCEERNLDSGLGRIDTD